MTEGETVEIHRALLRTSIAVVIAVLACVLACARSTPSGRMENDPDAGPDSPVISVDAPIAIGFFPLVELADWSEGDQLAADHFSFAMSDLSTCLQGSNVPVEIVEAKALLIDNLGERDVVDLSTNSNESIGCYLAAPGRPPMIVRAGNGASSLTVRCPSAAAVYFDVPTCCPEGFHCCPDGSPVGEESQCAQ